MKILFHLGGIGSGNYVMQKSLNCAWSIALADCVARDMGLWGVIES